jgi:DNA polymerase type B, organellar and viral
MENKLSDNQHIWMLFRLQWSNNQFVTIGKLVKLNKEDKNYVFDLIMKNMEDKSDYYKEQSLNSMIFSYTIKKGRAKDKITLESNINQQYQNFKHHKLPITMNPLEYGLLIEKSDNKFIVQINRTNIAIITQYDELNEVKFFKEGQLIYKYKDHKIDDSTFIRTLNNKKFTFKNNELVLLTINKSSNFIKSLLVLSNLSNKTLIMDIETYIKDGILVPYLICWNDGINKHSYFVKDFADNIQMMKLAIKDLMIKKYDNYKVYIHNLAKFDGIFLLKMLTELGQVKPVIHHGNLISIGFKFNSYNITFRDSLQLLIFSLKKLGISFGVDTKKSIFPHSFVNENNLDYIGQVPGFKYFNGITREEYIEYCKQFNNNWSLRDETIKYNITDCISLYQIIHRFSEMIFDLFNINIHNYPTLPSLAFAIFRSNFMKEENIPQLSGKIAKDIRTAYTGGSCDMFIPENPDDSKVFCYDVNSLYPSVMNNNLMPIGLPNYFKGNIRLLDDKAFGFFYCKITAPDNLNHPILQTHVKTVNGMRTISPLGSWEDMIFSVEMDNAMKYGYKFEILWGYTFKSGYIFSDYVNTLYNFRLQYPKSDPMNYLAKILLNSLYGRFGMDDNFIEVNIIHEDYYSDFENKFIDNIIDSKKLGEYVLVRYINDTSDIQDDTSHNISIGVASAITAYARIHMSQFKNDSCFNLYYTDTDSIYVDKALPDYLVDSKILGKLKLENISTKALFLSPKVYCLNPIEGNIIYKVKGLSHETELTVQDFKNLLFKDAFIQKTHVKWFRDLSKGEIQLLEQIYTLKVTENKRRLIYKKGKLIGTKPYIINNDKELLF